MAGKIEKRQGSQQAHAMLQKGQMRRVTMHGMVHDLRDSTKDAHVMRESAKPHTRADGGGDAPFVRRSIVDHVDPSERVMLMHSAEAAPKQCAVCG
jgi:hypothetical protein